MTASRSKRSGVRRWLPRVAIALFGLMVVGAVVLVIVTRKPSPIASPAIQARLQLAAGSVDVIHDGKATRARSGMALLADAGVKTADGARALVQLPDGATLFMRGGSELKLASDHVSLTQGEYWLNAPPTDRKPLVHRLFDVTVTAVDSGLSIKKAGGRAVIYVARGTAIVTGKGGRVEVNSGEQVAIKDAEVPRVAPLAFWDDWTGGMADFASGGRLAGEGTGTIYGVDVGASPGAKARRLEISKQSVRAVVRDGLSETEVDQTFFNPGGRDVEGWYWFTVPERASVTGFAVETNGVLVDGEFTEKREAAKKYTRAKSSGHAPAILEWIDARTYRARIFPVKAGGDRRVVLRYVSMDPVVDQKLTYVYPMGQGDPVRIGEFSLSVDLGTAGPKMQIATLADARIEGNGRRVTMRRSGYTPRAPFHLEAVVTQKVEPLSLARMTAGGQSADYVMARYRPDVDWDSAKDQHADVVVVVDTSAAGDESARQLKAQTAEAILRALSAEDRFALVSLDVRPKVLHPAKGLSRASEKEIANALEQLAEHAAGGATDLASLFDVSLQRLHGAEQPAVVYVGDGVATSGEMTGEQLIERLRRALSTSRARLFAVGVGPESDHALLGELARAGGGQAFRVDESGATTAQALELIASIKIPTITDFAIDMGAGLDEPFMSASGKVSKGSEVVLLARTHHDLPAKVKVTGRLGGKPFEREYKPALDKSVAAAFVPRLWAAEYVRRLLGAAQGPEAERGRVAALGIEYGLMTPFTSILALESESAYARMGIKRRRSKLRGVRLSALTPVAEARLTETLSAPALPAVAVGCSRKDAPNADEDDTAAAQTEQPSTAVADEDNRLGGTGTRAKGEPAEPEAEATPKPSRHRYGVRGPSGASGVKKSDGVTTTSPNSGDGLGVVLPRGKAAGNQAAPAPRASARAESGKSPSADKSRRGEGRWNARQADLGTCSDTARRPLAQRVIIWRKRIATARGAADLVQRYNQARRACELTDWRSERTFLEILQTRIGSEGGARLLLAHFRSRPEVQKFVAKSLLRRTVDAHIIAAVEGAVFGSSVVWNKVDIELSEIKDLDKRIARLREHMARVPTDPNGDIRLVRLLAKAGRKDAALNLGRRLRDRGFLTPHIARQLGDVLARASLDAEAVRTYSEIVEFDPRSTPSRRLLGDIYLGHGWYGPAYRQYKTITEATPKDSLAWLRLAAAAAGAGRVDEALRLQRQVASAQGTPGPRDPRRWARLLSAARLARLLHDPPPPTPGQPKVDPARRAASIKRELKELQLLTGPGVLVLLTWEDFGSQVALSTVDGDKAVALGETIDAADAGLSAVLLSQADFDKASFQARLTSVPREDELKVVRHDIQWDGRDFVVQVRATKLAVGAVRVAL